MRAEAGAQAREAGHLPEIGEQLLDLLLELVHVPLPLHDADKRTHARNLLGMKPIRRLLKLARAAFGVLLLRLVRRRAAGAGGQAPEAGRERA